ncbi:Uncharacterised protein [Mycobacteroides abscessus subsp. massiliense]|uniref:hypothetical protein n=1 Tax=Mycobacteroides abscessus TaxID=36809 RepID=UPI0009A685F4|nr:hypothetical protein [Mycobacteroides abscessus]SKD26175.1 Uncharacterised protein [Mycobacteroides abscessus subsp. massiliense]SKD46426.1 Uncharacterised protein [Mycobacteroides abscessus subsp. massiliense]SKD58358.1 Uncharacterised protein [Mycobacteroides abscessus subsp. massiliense]SKD90320.1 Uncharacterised protein [Mycobacteroides abscessus subsp. massiliense]SKE04901.1 Uncharacterised protein [Mycobacteroides abscessus subsp. massiliense]
MNPRSILFLVQRFFSEGPSRKVLRRRLVALSVLPALLLLGFAMKLIVMVSTGYAAQSHYLAYDSYSLRDDVRILKSWNIVDSYKAYFTEGDRYVLEGRLAEAETEFKESLKRVDPPESCPVRINLEVVLETRGDLKSADHKREDATKFWEEALAVTREAPAGCFNTTSEPDEAVRKYLNETEQRLLDKLKDPPATSASPSPTTSPSPPPSEGGGGGDGGGGQGGGNDPNDGQGGGNDPTDGQRGGDQNGQPNPLPGEPTQEGSSPGQPTQAPTPVGPDRIPTSGANGANELHPDQGDPADVLKRSLENSTASGTDTE